MPSSSNPSETRSTSHNSNPLQTPATPTSPLVCASPPPSCQPIVSVASSCSPTVNKIWVMHFRKHNSYNSKASASISSPYPHSAAQKLASTIFQHQPHCAPTNASPCTSVSS